MAEYIERTEELALAMNAGARAIEHTWRYYGAVYTKDFWTDNSQEISYLRAAKILLEASDAPAADVAPVVHGRWIRPHWKNSNYCYDCSECGGEAMHRDYQWAKDGIYPICPNCGARMDGDAERRNT
jgi:hypothetical protein